MHDHDHHNGHHHHHHAHHDHHHHGGGASGYGLAPAGHNAAAQVAQWQEPHHHHHPHEHAGQPEPDFDLVEAAFAENFPRASDPTSFLRLAGIPFVARDAKGRTLNLLRVEYEEATDVGSVTPHVGGETFRYDPLPAQMVSTRKRLRFVYQDGEGVVRLSLGEVRGLTKGGA